MTTELSGAGSWRRPTLNDAEAILGLVSEHNVNLIGFADVTLSDVRDELTEPGFDPTVDGWIIHDGAGMLVGYGWARRKGESDLVDIDVVAKSDAVADWLWNRVLGRAAQIGAEAGNETIRADIGIFHSDTAQQGRAASRGFVPATTFQRMRIDFGESPLQSTVADDVVLRGGPGDEGFRRDAHRVYTRAFRDHFGFVEKSFEAWHETIQSSGTHDWEQLRVAYLDGEPVGMLRGADDFVEDENCGYVATVAVVSEARGRGLAKTLLRQAFADDFRRGRRGTILHVDANNVTPALDLYLGVGMQPVLAITVWRCRLPTD